MSKIQIHVYLMCFSAVRFMSHLNSQRNFILFLFWFFLLLLVFWGYCIISFVRWLFPMHIGMIPIRVLWMGSMEWTHLLPAYLLFM